jgi:16S rRNA G966 N2-methylase RsmD
VFCDPPFADVAIAEATLGHDGLRSAVAPGGLLVARAHGKHLPVVPPFLDVARVKEIGEEKLLFLRYIDPTAGG